MMPGWSNVPKPPSIREMVATAASQLNVITVHSVVDTISEHHPKMAPTPKEVQQHLRYLGYISSKERVWRHP
jgi:hypothetical protein